MNEIFLEQTLKEFLREDLGSVAIDFSSNKNVVAKICAEEGGIFCGGTLIAKTLNLLIPKGEGVSLIEMGKLTPEGEAFVAGEILAQFSAPSEAFRHGIRTVLNLVAHLTGIATHTAGLVQQVSGFSCRLLDTRKTTPGLRVLEKYAVRVGGGSNHRMGRFDGVMIKKEDIAIDGGIAVAIDRAEREKTFLAGVEIEVETLADLDEVLKDGRVKTILLDNMDLKTLQQAVERCGRTHRLEASGVREENLRAVAATGVHAISLSSLILGARPTKLKAKIDNL